MKVLGKKILVVEDDFDIREALHDLLTLEGFELLLAADGQDALNQLRSSDSEPDAILLDLVMPVKDGYEFLQERDLDPRLARIPVIVMTANQALTEKPLGSSAFLRKPVGRVDLLAAIEGVVS
jgi:CheY-like chemotaxis protein